MSTVKEDTRGRTLDKNLQDDWLPDQQRRADATSKQLTEYGGNLKRKETTANNNPANPPSQDDKTSYKKKGV